MLALIGLDSVSPHLMDELVETGRMPALAALRERGRSVTLETPGSRLPAGAFPSLWTGLEVEEHGLYYPFVWSATGQRVVPSGSLPLAPAIWEHIAATGRRVLVVDPYEGRAPTRTVSTCLSGVQLRNRVVLESWGSPPGALRAWERKLGRAPAAQEVFGRQDVGTLVRLARTLRTASARAASLVEQALPVERPDVLIVMFPAVHLAGHQLWDPRAVLPAGTAIPPELETGIRDVYAAADNALGRIVAALPDDADIILFSVLGMTHNTSRSHLLPAMLGAVLEGRRGSGATTGSAWRLRAGVPTRLRAAVARGIPDRLAVALAARVELRGVDWATTRAFCVPSDVQGLIRVNLRDRERDGIVDADEVEELFDEVEDGLTSFVQNDGSPVVRSVERLRDTVPAGSRRDMLPDLVVHWSQSPAHLSPSVESPRFGAVQPMGAGTGRSGNHTDEAWALVVPGDSLVEASSRPNRITDLSATVLAACGVETSGAPLLA